MRWINDNPDLCIMELNRAERILASIQLDTAIFKKAEIREELIRFINYLLFEDFNLLLHLLYRVDVNEEKLKILVKENPGKDTATIIADMLIERQEEKLRTKALLKDGDDVKDEEKW